MQLYVSLKINLDIPFPNSIKACKIFQPIIPVEYPYIKDSVVVSQNKNQSKTVTSQDFQIFEKSEKSKTF